MAWYIVFTLLGDLDPSEYSSSSHSTSDSNMSILNKPKSHTKSFFWYHYVLRSSAQSALCTWNLTLSTRYYRSSLSNCHSQCLERTLRSVMIVITPQTIHMQCDSCALCKTLQAMWDHFTTQISNLFSLESQIYDSKWTVRNIDNGSRKCFIERAVCGSKTCNAHRGTEGLCKWCAECDTDVFGGMVVID